MLRTTIYLEEDIALLLRHLSETTGRSQSDIIREGIRTYVSQLEGRRERSLPPGAGKFSSGRSDVSEKAEQILKKRARTSR